GSQMDVHCLLETIDDKRRWAVKALLDSGCTGTSVSRCFVKKNHITTMRTLKPIKVFNADGTENADGPITEYVEFRLVIGNHAEKITAAVTNLGS
ncbi:hypothetical protein K435DRAFT_599523, partial [Dendrothele bispora CBS 962.96]